MHARTGTHNPPAPTHVIKEPSIEQTICSGEGGRRQERAGSQSLSCQRGLPQAARCEGMRDARGRGETRWYAVVCGDV